MSPTPASPFEVRRLDLPLPAAGEIDAILFDGAWTALDVYVDARGQANALGATVNVYAVTEGVQSAPVASGVLTAGTTTAAGVHVVRVAGAKVGRRWRVTIVPSGLGATASPVRIAAVGYGTEPA